MWSHHLARPRAKSTYVVSIRLNSEHTPRSGQQLVVQEHQKIKNHTPLVPKSNYCPVASNNGFRQLQHGNQPDVVSAYSPNLQKIISLKESIVNFMENNNFKEKEIELESMAIHSTPASPNGLPGVGSRLPLPALAVAASSILTACGGGDPALSPSFAGTAVSTPATMLTRKEASRFLSQCSFSSSAEDIQHVRDLGIDRWLDEQFAMPQSESYVDGMSADGYLTNGGDSRVGLQKRSWRKLISSPDVLRQRITLALSEIIVLSATPVRLQYRGFAVGAFMDILESNAFGNYGTLLLQVSRSPAMGSYLSFINNKKADPATGSQPDENYAREVMQLFSIGLLNLNVDGTPNVNGPKETYTQDDVNGMARVFTGWMLNHSPGPTTNTIVNNVIKPLIPNSSLHEFGQTSFLGATILAGTAPIAALQTAINTLMAHPSMAPFISRQLIQRLVLSNPDPLYIARVANVFNNNGLGVKGDLKAVVRAILTDPAARDMQYLQPVKGKLREPMVRFIQWARTFKLHPSVVMPPPTANSLWAIGDLSDPATRLGQSPLQAPSVFNFFRPGFVPPINSALGQKGITAPEFQITNASSVAGYVNFMQGVIGHGIPGMLPDYSAFVKIAQDSRKLLDELNVLLAAGQLSDSTVAKLAAALATINVTTDDGKLNRIRAAITFVMVSPEYIVLK